MEGRGEGGERREGERGEREDGRVKGEDLPQH